MTPEEVLRKRVDFLEHVTSELLRCVAVNMPYAADPLFEMLKEWDNKVGALYAEAEQPTEGE